MEFRGGAGGSSTDEKLGHFVLCFLSWLSKDLGK